MEAAEKTTQDLGLPKDRTSRVVDLSNKELGRLPSELAEFSDLQLLTLKKNKLNTLGPEIGTPFVCMNLAYSDRQAIIPKSSSLALAKTTSPNSPPRS